MIAAHPFINRPHRTLLNLALPVLLSLIAEPVTGLVDTAFVARQGEVAAAALGVGTVALSSFFWIFNFLGIGAQTGVAQALGREREAEARETASFALLLAAIFGVALIIFIWPLLSGLARALGADAAVAAPAVAYMRWRLLGAPAVLVLLVVFGAMRGRQDMRPPFVLATLVNGLNILLDWLLIDGVGPLPALGISGAAIASSISQWLGAAVALLWWGRQMGLVRPAWQGAAVISWLRLGRDLSMRTGLLFVFLLLATRVATQAGATSGAAHQAIRQVYIFTALFLEAFATTAQSLVGYFMGGGSVLQARRVARLTLAWSVGTGVFLMVVMLAAGRFVAALLVPASAVAIFLPAWAISAWAQPLNALAFITDGLHWGSGDFAYLRNGMFLATLTGALVLLTIDPATATALNAVWLATVVWIVARAIAGLVRIWPGIGRTPWAIVRRDSIPPEL